jgi:hypothetical protein
VSSTDENLQQWRELPRQLGRAWWSQDRKSGAQEKIRQRGLGSGVGFAGEKKHEEPKTRAVGSNDQETRKTGEQTQIHEGVMLWPENRLGRRQLSTQERGTFLTTEASHRTDSNKHRTRNRSGQPAPCARKNRTGKLICAHHRNQSATKMSNKTLRKCRPQVFQIWTEKSRSKKRTIDWRADTLLLGSSSRD